MRAARLTAVGTAALLAGAPLAAGCGGGGGADAAAETTTTSEPATEAIDDDVQAKLDEVVDALFAERAASCEAFAPPIPDPDHPDLLATRTGPVLETAQELATELREQGRAIKCPEDSRFDIAVLSFEFGEFDGDEAVWLEVCAVDDSERMVVETGEVVGGGLTAVNSTEGWRRVDGEWKLAERRVNEQWEGQDECAIA